MALGGGGAGTLKTSGKPGRQCQCLFQWLATSYCHQRSGLSRLAGTDPSNSDTATAVCVGSVCVRAGACVMCLQYTMIIFDPVWLVPISCGTFYKFWKITCDCLNQEISRNNYPEILKIHRGNVAEFCFLEMMYV